MMHFARHDVCVLRTNVRSDFLACQPVVGNTQDARVERVASSVQISLRGSQLAFFFLGCCLFGGPSRRIIAISALLSTGASAVKP